MPPFEALEFLTSARGAPGEFSARFRRRAAADRSPAPSVDKRIDDLVVICPFRSAH